MSWTDTIGRMLGADPRAVEAITIGDRIVPAGDTIDPDDDLFRRITGTGRSLSPIKLARAQAISLKLWRENAMAGRLTEMIVDFVVGNGLTYEAADDRVTPIIDRFWSDPRMDLATKHIDFVRDQSLYGELAFRVFENPQSGRIRLGFITSGRIDSVLLSPDDALVDETIILRATTGAELTPLQLVTYDDTDAANPQWVGEALYFPINRVTGQDRGTPDMLRIADYVDGYDQLLFNALERSGLLNAFIWDVTLKGADKAAIDARARDLAAPPAPGSVRVHNDAETWEAVSPNLGSGDLTAIGREVKNMGLGGAGVPEAWFANGDSANRATLAEQGDPTYRMLTRRQLLVRRQWEKTFRFVAERAKAAGQLPASADTEVQVSMPDPSTKDTKGIAIALPQLANALVAAVGEELISTESSRKVFLSIASLLGVELDADTETERIDAEAAAKPQPPSAGDPFAGLLDQLGKTPTAPAAQAAPMPMMDPSATPTGNDA